MENVSCKMVVCLTLLMSYTFVYAQDASLVKARDSNIVKELFFTGLKEKIDRKSVV